MYRIFRSFPRQQRRQWAAHEDAHGAQDGVHLPEEDHRLSDAAVNFSRPGRFRCKCTNGKLCERPCARGRLPIRPIGTDARRSRPSILRTDIPIPIQVWHRHPARPNAAKNSKRLPIRIRCSETLEEMRVLRLDFRKVSTPFPKSFLFWLAFILKIWKF